MANYICTFRTNYFGIKDKEFFDKFIAASKIQSEDINVYERDGKYMIGGYGSPVLFREPDNEFTSDLPENGNMFFNMLQKCIADDDAVIYKEAGYEKLRYIVLEACVITSEAMEFLDVDKQLMDIACNLLENEDWQTRMDY